VRGVTSHRPSRFHKPRVFKLLPRCTEAGDARRAYHADVEKNPRTDRTTAVVAAAAHDFNDELTVILNAVAHSLDTLPPAHPLFPGLIDAQCAARRCAQRASRMLEFSVRRGARPVAARVEALLAP